MKHILFLFSFFICSLASAQIVNIPDVNFKNALIQDDVDFNGDGEIQVSEAQGEITLNISFESITDLTGIEAFINLRELRVFNNQLSSVDVSNLSNLEVLGLTNNMLTSIDVSANLNLEKLYVSHNQLTTINVDSNTALTDLTIDDNQISTVNLSNNTVLNLLYVSRTQITSLDLSNNINLQTLKFDDGLITSLDLSNNTSVTNISGYQGILSSINLSNISQLESINLPNNQLTSIDISGLPNLNYLNVESNNITTIDASNNPNLETIFAESNQLINVNLNGAVSLTNIGLFNNQLTTIDVTTNTALLGISIGDNQLTDIDLSNNLNLSDLHVFGNLFTQIDVSFISTLQIFNFSNNPNLVFINMKNGENTFYSAEDNFLNLPSLEAVCIDQVNSNFANLLDNEVTNSVVITEYCSFTPGGDYNTITGNITYDGDNNGCDTNDADFPFVRINIDDGTDTGAAYTNTDGEYTFYTEDGNFTITPSLENPSFFNITPIDATINFPDNNNNIQIEDFCITANGIHNDVEIVIAPIFPARPGFDAQYLLTYKNKGNQTLSGSLSFQYDDTVLDFVTSTQTTTSQTVGQLTWDYNNLMPFESRSIYVTLSVNAPTDTPAVNIDDELNFTATVNPVAGDDLPNDNVFNFNQTVVGAFDPNNIICIEGDVVDPSEIGSFLHYVVNFENTGNFPAENIVIEIEIDPNQYDINALYLLSSSHNAQVSIADNIVKIIFQSIYLASGGHGNILLKIPTQLSLQPQDFVTKNADIFFDYNFPIETNNAQTTFATLSNPEFGGDRSITMYPNPTKDNIYITADNPIKNIELYDIQGRIVKQEKYNSKQVNVNIANQAPGIYFIKISTEKGINTEKVIKM